MPEINTNLFGKLPIIANAPQAPMLETLTFLTDVSISQNGSEFRQQMRSIPRTSFKYTINSQLAEGVAIQNTIAGAIRKKWAIPIWSEAQVVFSILQNAPFIECDTSLYDLRPNSIALIYSNCNKWEVAEISQVNASGISINSPVSAYASAYLIPIRLGFVENSAERVTNGNTSSYILQFNVEDAKQLQETIPAQYKGSDIYFEPFFIKNASVSRQIEQRQDIADFETGVVEYRTTWLNSRYGTPFSMIAQGAEEIANLKKWIGRRLGKFRNFWLPTFDYNLRIVSQDLIGSEFLAKSDYFISFATNRKHLAFQKADGNWEVREIAAVSQLDSETIKFNLTASLNLKSSEINNVSFLGLNRLNTDRFELNWIGNNTVECEFLTLELQQ